jgi:hypothetical protein
MKLSPIDLDAAARQFCQANAMGSYAHEIQCAMAIGARLQVESTIDLLKRAQARLQRQREHNLQEP